MIARNILRCCWVLMTLALPVGATDAAALTIYVDSRRGDDANEGTRENPLKTIGRAAELIRRKTEAGPVTVKIAPGLYSLAQSVDLEAGCPFTEEDRLVIEALVLPGDPKWTPTLMPVILSVEDPRKSGELNRLTETYGFRIKTSHVTIRGLRFLGNPLLCNWHCPVSRVEKNLEDLAVTQCMFVGDPNGFDIYCAVLATGDAFVVDHCIFYNCHASPVFWDGPDGTPGKRNAMRYCIVDGASISGVWTCQTAEDFEFHHNIVTRSEYFWMRGQGKPIKYRLHDCIVASNKHYSGYGVPGGPTGETGAEIAYEEKNVIKEGKVVLERDKRAKNYLYVVPGTLGSDLGAGLFKK